MMLAAGERAAERTLHRLEHLDRKYASAWINITNSMDMPEVRAADAALDRMIEKATPFRRPSFPFHAPNTPLRILSIVRPVADLSPRPRIHNGKIQEIVWIIDPQDLSALSQVLELKAAGDSNIAVDVLMTGGQEHENLMRTIAGSRTDNLYRLDAAPDAGHDAYIKVLRDLEIVQPYKLICIGESCLNGDQSLGAYVAGSLNKQHSQREYIADGTGLGHIALPAVIDISAAGRGPETSINDVVGSAFSSIQIKEPVVGPASSPSRFELPAGSGTIAKTITKTIDAAEYLKTFAAAASAASAEEYKSKPKSGRLTDGAAVWAILDPNEQKSNSAVLRAACFAADLRGRTVKTIIPSPGEMWPQLLGLAEANGCGQAFCVDTHNGRLSNIGKQELVRILMKTSDEAILFAGTKWGSSLAFAAGESHSASHTLLCSGVTGIKKDALGGLVFSLPAYDGKLVREHVHAGGRAFITISPEADFPAPGRSKEFEAIILDLKVSHDWIMPLPAIATPTLAQAEVIIDLGYGIRDKAGLELAQDLKNKLEAIGLAPMFGATRKVTQDLKLLPLDAQIGQTGVRVNPKLIIALGISGAPQHIDYLGARAEIFCFNKDSEAPLMKLNQARRAPRVHPILGDIFVTVREFIVKLG